MYPSQIQLILIRAVIIDLRQMLEDDLEFPREIIGFLQEVCDRVVLSMFHTHRRLHISMLIVRLFFVLMVLQ